MLAGSPLRHTRRETILQNSFATLAQCLAMAAPHHLPQQLLDGLDVFRQGLKLSQLAQAQLVPARRGPHSAEAKK